MWGRSIAAAAALTAVGAAQAAEPQASLGLEASTTYYDNFLKLGDGEAKPVGMSRDDLVTEVGVTGRASLPVGQQTLFARGRAGFSHHLQNKEFDHAFFGLTGGADWKASERCGGTVALSADRRQVEQEDVIGVVDGIKMTYGAAASAECLIATNYFASLEGSYSLVDSSVDQSLASSTVSDGDGWTVKSRFGYTNQPLSKLGVFLGYAQWTTDALDQEQTRRISGGVGGRYQVGPKLNVSAEAGLARVQSAAGDEALTWVAEGEAEWQVTPKVLMTLGLSRGVDLSSDVAADYVVANTAQLSAEWAAFERIRLRGWVSYALREYSGSSRLEGLTEDYENRQLTTGLQGGYRVNDHVDLKLVYQFKDRDSSVEGKDSQSHQITLGLGMVY